MFSLLSVCLGLAPGEDQGDDEEGRASRTNRRAGLPAGARQPGEHAGDDPEPQEPANQNLAPVGLGDHGVEPPPETVFAVSDLVVPGLGAGVLPRLGWRGLGDPLVLRGVVPRLPVPLALMVPGRLAPAMTMTAHLHLQKFR